MAPVTHPTLSAYVRAGEVLYLRLEGWKASPLTIEVYDLRGQRLLQKNLSLPTEVISLPLVHFPAGLYYAWAYQEGQVAKVPFLLNP